MTEDRPLLTLILSILGALAFVVLMISRWYISRHDRRREMRRLMFVDALLVIAGIELVSDAVAEFIGHGVPGGDIATAIAFWCRGALAAGGIALVATIKWEKAPRFEELGGRGGPGGAGGAGGEGAPGQPGALGENGWGGKGGAGGAGGAGGSPGEKP